MTTATAKARRHEGTQARGPRGEGTAKMADGGPTAGNRQSGAGTGTVNGMMGGSCGTSRHAGLASIGRGTGITIRKNSYYLFDNVGFMV